MTALRLVDPSTELAAALASGAPEVTLSGVAGTGKTTLVRDLRGALLQVAPTNKAARRLQDVTGRETTTIHSLIYGAAREEWVRPDGGVCQGYQEDPADPASPHHEPPGCPGCTCTSRLAFGAPKGLDSATLLVVDEASMVGRRTADDIRRAATGRQILWVGDPAQLPPVGDEPGVALADADVLLTRVWRSDGGILQLATAIREAEGWEDLNAALSHQYTDVTIASGGIDAVAEWRVGHPDRMAITHTNRDRQGVNADVRRRLAALRGPARAGPLVAGDRLLIRQNVRGEGGTVIIANGEVHAVIETEPVPDTPYIAVTCQLDGVPSAPSRRFVVHPAFLAAHGNDDWGRQARVMRDTLRPHTTKCWTCRGGDEPPPWEIEHDGPGYDEPGYDEPPCDCPPFAGLAPVNAQYGYAITAHAAQGSEAEEVGVLWTPHSHRRSFEDARSWLYTAVTRARSRLWVWR
jgi:ATP-dependent exoDNAse (exonuclease V) alpha subunit